MGGWWVGEDWGMGWVVVGWLGWCRVALLAPLTRAEMSLVAVAIELHCPPLLCPRQSLTPDMHVAPAARADVKQSTVNALTNKREQLAVAPH